MKDDDEHNDHDNDNDDDDYHALLLLPYGHVMKELGQRILSRNIAQSNALIVSSSSSSSTTTKNNHHNHKKKKSVAYNLLQHAKRENHTIHTII